MRGIKNVTYEEAKANEKVCRHAYLVARDRLHAAVDSMKTWGTIQHQRGLDDAQAAERHTFEKWSQSLQVCERHIRERVAA